VRRDDGVVAELPSGTVSMLFSDVEQSTLLLTRLGRAYEQALDACRTAQRTAWTSFNGVEMGTEGDSFFVVFSTAEDAIGAAAEAQRMLAGQDWPADGEVRVRMGIHTGSPRIHDGGYVGIDVHRAARIAAAAHGGQVVVSEAATHLVAQSLGDGVSLRDLGGHRLKDLNLPEHLFQLLIPGLPTQFPPLRSLGAVSSLPVTVTPLVGRRSEVSELKALVLDREVRLVTLTGTGGSGKTRLAVAAAREAVDGFPDGVYFVPLAAVTSADVIWSAIGGALDLPIGERTPPVFFDRVARLRALVVLDNLEQMQGADGAVATLLGTAPDLTVLATSRRPLHLSSEHQYEVAPLPLPASNTLEAAHASPAVQLFVDRACAVRTSFDLTADNSSDVAAICRHLDGLPLAIELAAARSKLLGPRALLARLDGALDLRGSGADRPPRQRALRDTIDWSYRLLPSAQQAMFRRLGVFAGGADLDAVMAVCHEGASSEGDTVAMLEDLIDASLVTVGEDDDGEPRFALLETVRAFALDGLREVAELEDARRAHAAHFVDVADRLSFFVVWASHEQALRGNRLFERELSNFREVARWASAPSPSEAPAEPGTVTRHHLGLAVLSRACHWLWSRFDPAECRRWLEDILAVTESEDSVDRATCQYEYAYCLMQQGDLAPAREIARSSVAALRGRDDEELAWALLDLGQVELALESFAAARQACEEAVAIARELGNDILLGHLLNAQSLVEGDEGNWEAGLEVLQESRRAFERGGWDYLPLVDHNTACMLAKLGHAQEAHRLMSKGLHEEARTYRPVILHAIAEDYAAVLADAGFASLTPLVLAACDAARERMGTSRDQRFERIVADARATAEPTLTPAEWTQGYERGKAMSVLDALAEALSSTTGLQL
jgi:predicted ATPase/class 3 adenylate cyclase